MGPKERKVDEEVLNTGSTSDPGKFLGLPSIWERLKKESMGFLKNKIRDKLAGWRSNILNWAEKEVLNKEIIMVIPTYVMSIFHLPKTWCSEINLLIIEGEELHVAANSKRHKSKSQYKPLRNGF